MKDELGLFQVKMCRFINTINQLFYFSGNSISIKKLSSILIFWQNFPKRPLKNMIFHYFGFHRIDCVTCPQPLNLPCTGPASSIGSIGSLV